MCTLVRLIRRLKQDPGQALIEYILVLPIVFLLIVNAVNFGGFFYAWITVTNAARAGADYAVLGGASVGAPGSPTGAQVLAMITADIASLPNSGSLVVNVCQTNNGTTRTLTGTCSSIAADPEVTNFVLTSVDVKYTYQPFVKVFSFPKLGVFLTLPQTAIRKVAVMRAIQ
jgi:Flp pilus assembly protein TadG